MILEELINFICEQMCTDEGEIDENTTLNYFVRDEYEMQDFTEAVEKEFGVEFESELNDDFTLTDLTDLILSLQD